jgi:hypothetical protein
LFVDHAREVLIPHHISFLAKLADVDLAAKVSVSDDVCYLEISHFKLKTQGFCNVLYCCLSRFFGIRLTLRTDDDHST